MVKQAPAPKAATQEEDLPKTAVKESKPNREIMALREKLAQYAENTEEPISAQPVSEPGDTWEKRYGDLRRHMQKKEKETQDQVRLLQAQIQEMNRKEVLPETKEQFEIWKNNYPQIAQFVEMIAEEKAAERSKELETQLEEVGGRLKLTQKEKDEALLRTLVPDVEQILSAAEFKEWYSNQPVFVQDKLSASDDPEEVAYYLNIYKSVHGAVAVPKAKTNKLDALNTSVGNSGSAPTRSSTPYKFTTSQIKKMDAREFAKREAEIDEARRSGAIFDDSRQKIWHTDI